jgi:hypothetical protein
MGFLREYLLSGFEGGALKVLDLYRQQKSLRPKRRDFVV